MSQVRIEPVEGAEVEGKKRQYAPFIIHWKCECGADCKKDLTEDYLSYPTFGVAEQKSLYCHACETGLVVQLRLSLALEVLQP